MKCIKCNTEISDTAKFCPKCGTKVKDVKSPDVIFCPKCGAPYPITAKFCKKDGTPLQFEIKKKTKKSSKIWIPAAVCGVLISIIAGVGSYLYFSGQIFNMFKKSGEEVSTYQINKSLQPLKESSIVLPAIRERIIFPRGSTSVTFIADLREDLPIGYVLTILKGQDVFITISDNSEVGITVLDPENNIITPILEENNKYRFTVPETGDYTIVLSGKTKVQVTILIPPLFKKFK